MRFEVLTGVDKSPSAGKMKAEMVPTVPATKKAKLIVERSLIVV